MKKIYSVRDIEMRILAYKEDIANAPSLSEMVRAKRLLKLYIRAVKIYVDLRPLSSYSVRIMTDHTTRLRK